MTWPVESSQWLINWQLFNLMINNYDSHGKNVSLFFDKISRQFTPAYDLVNVAMFPQIKHVLAMGMGDEFEPKDIHAYQLADFAETCGIDKKLLSRLLMVLSEKVMKILQKNRFLNEIVKNRNFTEQDIAYLKVLTANIEKRTNYLQSQAVNIALVNV